MPKYLEHFPLPGKIIRALYVIVVIVTTVIFSVISVNAILNSDAIPFAVAVAVFFLGAVICAILFRHAFWLWHVGRFAPPRPMGTPKMDYIIPAAIAMWIIYVSRVENYVGENIYWLDLGWYILVYVVAIIVHSLSKLVVHSVFCLIILSVATLYCSIFEALDRSKRKPPPFLCIPYFA